jgi:activating signal cointegrator 1
MKTLTLMQPWATLVALEVKRIETRSWCTSYRGPLAIRVASRISKAAISLCWDTPYRTALEAGGYLAGGGSATNPFGLPLGAVIAVVALIDVRSITLENQPAEPEYSFGDYTPGRFAWILHDVHCLQDAVPAKGRLGLWEWTAPVNQEGGLLNYCYPTGILRERDVLGSNKKEPVSILCRKQLSTV